ncbi:hypothetical protein D0T84_00860 [Dysgonomonas sp. 521]|uniref:hypothetical protein n=1 Tax=Dysgonomonas sp. 521 TaxID=2302932 RepID=UPI0013D788E3|nr:hypothetical protein [Dysgonomonas sp. 521]NDV93468.1 hypothetical protein [Dysgonomonas sp. 521]
MTELEQYQKTTELLNMQGEKPTDEQVQETISIINDRLAYKPINRHVNAAVKEGYLKAVEILESKEVDFNKVDASGLKTVQGRAIASLACDYLVGLCAKNTLLMVPLKDETWGKHKRELEDKLGIKEVEL